MATARKATTGIQPSEALIKLYASLGPEALSHLMGWPKPTYSESYEATRIYIPKSFKRTGISGRDFLLKAGITLAERPITTGISSTQNPGTWVYWVKP